MSLECDSQCLSDYFLFLDPLDIRIKGHRIGIDDVLYYYLEGHSLPEIVERFPTLNMEKICAALTYYYRHQAEMDDYLAKLAAWREQQYQEWLANPDPLILRLRAERERRRRAEDSNQQLVPADTYAK